MSYFWEIDELAVCQSEKLCARSAGRIDWLTATPKHRWHNFVFWDVFFVIFVVLSL